MTEAQIPNHLSQHAIASRLADARMLVSRLRDDMEAWLLDVGMDEAPGMGTTEQDNMTARVAYLDGLIDDMSTLHKHVVQPDSDPDPVIAYIMQERL